MTPKLWLETGSLTWPIILSQLVNVISVVMFIVFWCKNPDVRIPANVELVLADERVVNESENSGSDITGNCKNVFEKNENFGESGQE